VALIDMLGSLFGGGGDVGNDALAAQLGIDPEQLRRTAAMNGLGAMGANMLAAAGPSLHPHSFASDAGQGILAGQQRYGDTTSKATSQGYMLGELRRMKSQDDRDAATLQGEKDWVTQLSDPAFVSTLPPELQRNVSVLRNMPRAQGMQYILESSKEAAATAKQDKKDALGVLEPFGENNSGLRRVLPDGTVNVLMPPRYAPPPGSGPSELEKAGAYLKLRGIPDDQINSILSNHFAPGLDKAAPATPADKADANATAKRIGELDKNSDTLDKRIASAQAILSGFQNGTYDTEAGLGLAGNASLANSMPSMLGEKPRLTQTAVNNYLLETLGDLHNVRGSNMLTGVVQSAKGGLGISNANNVKLFSNTILPALQQAKDAIDHERDFYRADPANTIRAYKPPAAAGALAGQTASTLAPGAGTTSSAPGAQPAARPAGLPSTAMQDSHGNWYDPASGKIYQQR
jgi:hypothetical protein